MSKLDRRDFLKLGAGASTLLAAAGCPSATIEVEETIVGEIDSTGLDYSPTTGAERQRIPSACWQCVARDGIVAFVEDGRLEHIEGNPELLRTNGKLCSRGQGGVGQVYDPDRLLFPMRRVAGTPRGGGQWERVSWTEALDDLEARLAPLLAAGTPEQFMFHYGRMKASASKMIKSYFLKAFGTGTIGNHTSICESAKWTSQELVWGKHYDVNDVMNSSFILNFGCNVNETHTNHLAFSQRVVKARADNGTRMVTFDVRLSNTAARSSEWVPIFPGTDLAVALAMAYVILVEESGPTTEGATFIEDWTTTTVADLTDFVQNPANHVPAAAMADQPAGGYTPEWAEGISGVSAAKIRELAIEYLTNSPGATIISYRGVTQHYNGVEAERAIFLLEALGGNLEVEGGRVHAVGAGWDYHDTYDTPSTSTSKLSILDGVGYAYPSHHASHQVLKMIQDGSNGRPDIYMAYCYNPVYANGDCQENIDILTNESLIPYYVSIDVAYGEGTALADLILPDANYLERWDWEDMVSMNFIEEWYIRQPAIQPLGEARDFKDVCVDLATRLGTDAEYPDGVPTAEEFVEAACEDTPEIAAVGGFSYMRDHGAYWDPAATPSYRSHEGTVDLADYTNPEMVTEVLDLGDGTQKTITFWVEEGYGTDYRTTSKSYKHYIGQEVNGTVYKGFKPDKVNKSGLVELHSPLLVLKGFPALPAWMPIPEHQGLTDELVLTTYKQANQTHSRTQNCKYLSEITHSNPGWINPATASNLGISDGQSVRVTNTGLTGATQQSSIVTTARVTEEIIPGVIAISHHCGHWNYGRYASGNASPMRSDSDVAEHETLDPDMNLMWWTDHGVHPNWIIPNTGDPISGSHRWMDTVVTVTAA